MLALGQVLARLLPIASRAASPAHSRLGLFAYASSATASNAGNKASQPGGALGGGAAPSTGSGRAPRSARATATAGGSASNSSSSTNPGNPPAEPAGGRGGGFRRVTRSPRGTADVDGAGEAPANKPAPRQGARATAGRQTAQAQAQEPASAKAKPTKTSSGTGQQQQLQLQEELQQLEAALAKHRHLYFNQTPAISDAAYDELKRRFRELTARVRGVAAEDVPFPVGAPVAAASALRKVAHRVPMTSLAAVNSREEVEAWMGRTLARLAQLRPGASSGWGWVVEPKVDGLAVRVVYRRVTEGGGGGGAAYELQEAATRGDGEVGEDVTHNALHGGIQGLPLRFVMPRPPTPAAAAAAAAVAPVAAPPEWVEVRGEVYVRTADLQQVNKDAEAAGSSGFANTRNAASGGLRLLDPAECRRRRLSFVAYAALAPVAAAAPAAAAVQAAAAAQSPVAAPLRARHWDTLNWLAAAGFAVSSDNVAVAGEKAAVDAAAAWMARRASLGYDADGAVLKLDDALAAAELGVTAAGDPRWAVAWKFPAGEAVTRLEGVELNVGRAGQIAPVALLAAVELGGVTIRRASLHNAGRALAMGLHMGDWVVVRRSGDVIPQVMRVLPELRPPGAQPWGLPTCCPACGGPVRLQAATGKDAGEQLMCVAAEEGTGCGAQQERMLLNFATVCLKGSGLAKGVLQALLEAGLLEGGLPDFYTRLDVATLSALPRFGAARAESIAAAVAASRSMSSALLLQGLNIGKVGEAAAKALGAAYPRLVPELQRASWQDIKAATGLGQVVSQSVEKWMRQPDNQQLLQRLSQAGVACVASTPSAQQQPAAAPVGATATAPVKRASRGMARAGDSPAAEAAVRPAAGGAGSGAGAGGASGSGPLRGVAGMRVCITGTLEGPQGAGLKRSELQAMLEASGAEFHKDIKSNTQVLVVGADAGSKRDRAAKKGVRVMEEGEFWAQHYYR
ncbi:hypothetical protein HYH02_000141 [Chlamydomonas schloesseri]|uniref:DNA ligase (NAD(+)) n=1 Tax=Chlamydomonas schloesseri TaxID=2026947 RepID=A0A836B7K4_9CHLO|nr:hypothetical protein HYH02_000141 [Chlamydomonas schloesseri]|eukprot:KAG2450037.1 hypothetical protein HYH02_000141 [Chlamydomonas schloesseri]